MPDAGGQFGASLTPDPGRYACGRLFPAAYQNVMIMDEVLRHPSGRRLLGYRQGEELRSIMDRFVGNHSLESDWLVESDFGRWI